jgi:two-component system sensor histidine kinase VanS
MTRRGIFLKTFLYTMAFAVLLALVTAALFSAQIVSYYHDQSQRSLNRVYSQLAARAPGQGNIADVAAQFHEHNQSLSFYIEDGEGQVVYVTPNSPPGAQPMDVEEEHALRYPNILVLDDGYVLHMQDTEAADLSSLAKRVGLVFIIALAIGTMGAYVFARMMTKPIRALAADTKRMALLEDVEQPVARNDEIGELAADVHSMYIDLKEAISQLEGEIARERELEDAQRHFFATASHELKTPIAATSALLEGMIENVGDYKDHQKYLRECLAILDAQGKAVSAMLEVVKLDDGKVEPVYAQVDLGDAVERVLPVLRTLAEASGIGITLSIKQGQLCRTDKEMMAKALSNVVLNAVQNTPAGGEVRIWSEDAGETYRLSVLNTDARIDDDLLPRLFDPFFRADKARSRKDGRSGLGLTIVSKTLKVLGVGFALENASSGVLFWMDVPKA